VRDAEAEIVERTKSNDAWKQRGEKSQARSRSTEVLREFLVSDPLIIETEVIGHEQDELIGSMAFRLSVPPVAT
jgi:hypothetical protein